MAALDNMTIASVIEDFLFSINTTWDYFAVIGICCGSIIFVKFTVKCLSGFYTYILSRLCFTAAGDMPLKYGGSWAVVTGASDGIGRSYAKELAKSGMNIFLISRNIDKLKKVADEIESKFNVETRCYPIDLNAISSNTDKYDELENELSAINVGILINNVGIMYDKLQYFLTVSKERHLQIVDLNISATVLLTYMLLPGMVARKKGAIINVSSGASVQPTPLMTSYAASKAFIDSFTAALAYEYSPYGVDIMAVKPFYVSTNMTNRGKPNFLLADPDTYAADSLRTLGYTTKTYGYWAHGLFGLAAEYMPQWIYHFSCVYVNPYLWGWLTGAEADNKKVC